MVYLTMTASIMEALEKVQGRETITNTKKALRDNPPRGKNGSHGVGNTQMEYNDPDEEKPGDADAEGRPSKDSQEETDSHGSTEPSLKSPKLGNPISHDQVIDLSRALKTQGSSLYRLEDLLRGVRIYVPPPPLKAEPTSEYKALMARLRREEELRAYERMTNPPPPMETFSQRFPASAAARAFSSNHQPTKEDEDEEVTFGDINRQMTLIFNVLVSIFACAGAIWVAARWWSTPARLALSMSGSILVGIAEVVVYLGYIRRVGEAKGKAKQLKEVKEVMNTWVVGTGEEWDEKSIPIDQKDGNSGGDTRRRKLEVYKRPNEQ